VSRVVCLAPSPTLDYLHGGGGHLWVSLNWALGLEAAGCQVVWLEPVYADSRVHTEAAIEVLRGHLREAGVAARVAVFAHDGVQLPSGLEGLELAADADLLLSSQYDLPEAVIDRFPRSALLDIDPGLLQLWVAAGQIELARYDAYLTIGETVGTAEARFPDLGLPWWHTPPAVALGAWPATCGIGHEPFTTVSHWWGDWLVVAGESFDNSKRAAFLPYLDLPVRSGVPLELAVALDDLEDDRAALEAHGWQVRPACEVTSTPQRYRAYVQRSRGEFSCAKPSCVRLQNAWVSDRTLCYLASGKPAVVEHTGPSRLLPDSEGLLRFRTPAEAVAALDVVEAEYGHHARAARALAEEHFDAARVSAALLERALA
jgi:hypothetical protein